MHFVSIKTPEQMDLLALHRVRSRLVRQRTGVANQIRGFLLERGITVRQGLMPLRKALPDILSAKSDVLSARMINLVSELSQDWRRLDERIASVKDTIRAGRTRRSRAAAKDGKAGSVALDRAGLEAPSSQHAGNRACQ
jgi:transposase